MNRYVDMYVCKRQVRTCQDVPRIPLMLPDPNVFLFCLVLSLLLPNVPHLYLASFRRILNEMHKL